MTLLSVVRSVCAVVGVAAPTSVFASIGSNRTMFEMLNNANEMAQRIAYDTRDWTMLQRSQYLETGEPSAFGSNSTIFNLPANYKRLLLNSNMWLTTNMQTPLRFAPNLDEFVRRRITNENSAPGEWIITAANKVWVAPAVPVDANVVITYLDKNCVTLASGGVGDTFMADTDTFRLEERLLKLGMIANWKQQKGSPYAEDMGTYSDAIANAMGHDKPSPIIIGRSPISSYARTAYPWQVPTP